MSGYYDRPLAGIGGWLTFFLLVIGLFAPLRVIIETAGFVADPSIAAAVGDRWTAVAAWQGVLTVVQLGGFGFMTWRMLKIHTWQSVRITIAGLWIIQLGLNAMDVILISQLTGIPVGELLAGAGIVPFQALAFAGIWTAYLLRSERVANTYLKDSDPEQAAEVFS